MELKEKKSHYLDQLYEKLEKIREKNNLSKTQFSLNMGMSQNWYQQSLKKKIDITYSDVRLIEEIYKVKL